jgi:hypothetical protein
VEDLQISRDKRFIIKEEIKAENEGYIGKITIDFVKKEEKLVKSIK